MPSRTIRTECPTTSDRWPRAAPARPASQATGSARNAPAVDAVLCSTATRTRETLARTGIDAPAQFVDRLYDSSPGATLEVINDLGPLFTADVQTLLVIGHEPTTSELALHLAGDGDPTAIEQMSLKYPTSAIAMLRTAAPWDRLDEGGATLVAFHVPR